MPPKLLLVSPPQHRSQLLDVLEKRAWQVECAAGFRDASEKLSRSACYDLLFVDTELSDGSWLDLLEFAKHSGKTCEVIVCSRLGDPRLWAEVIQSGAYDFIAEPYEQQEITRIIENALNSQYMQRFRRTRVEERSPSI